MMNVDVCLLKQMFVRCAHVCEEVLAANIGDARIHNICETNNARELCSDPRIQPNLGVWGFQRAGFTGLGGNTLSRL